MQLRKSTLCWAVFLDTFKTCTVLACRTVDFWCTDMPGGAVLCRTG